MPTTITFFKSAGTIVLLFFLSLSRSSARDRFSVLLQFLLTKRFIISVLKHFRWNFIDFPSGPGFLGHSRTICYYKGCSPGNWQPCLASRTPFQDTRHQTHKAIAEQLPKSFNCFPLLAPSASPTQGLERQGKKISLFCVCVCLLSQVLRKKTMLFQVCHLNEFYWSFST